MKRPLYLDINRLYGNQARKIMIGNPFNWCIVRVVTGEIVGKSYNPSNYKVKRLDSTEVR